MLDPRLDYTKIKDDWHLVRVGAPYTEINAIDNLPQRFVLGDHLGGFDQQLRNPILTALQKYAESKKFHFHIVTDRIYDEQVKKLYPNLKFEFSMYQWLRWNSYASFLKFTQHQDIKIQNFICSFNIKGIPSRQLLIAALYSYGWFSSKYVCKNFVFSKENLFGLLSEHAPDIEPILSKFFGMPGCDQIFQTKYMPNQKQPNPKHPTQTWHNRENLITESWLNIVAESCGLSHVPFVTEKFLHSVVNRSLFITYGQPGWYEYLYGIYGFKPYNKIFSYDFDSEKNPVIRLIKLMDQLVKFSKLSYNDLTDIRLIEMDTIEFNRDWYFSGSYLKKLMKHA